MKDFDSWNKLKKEIHRIAKLRFFKHGEVWWVSLGLNIGHEADGKGLGYERPFIILKKYNNFSFLGIALTTTTKQNQYKFPIGIIEGKDCFVNLSQLRYLDARRLTAKITTLSDSMFKQVIQKTSQVNLG